MFDGVPANQFHQFIASSRTSSLPIPPSFPLHGSFDPYPSSHQTLESHLLHQLHHHQSPPLNKDEEEKEAENHIILSTNSSISERIDPWSNDEVLSLLRIRSSMDNWFPDFTWEHVSRKLAEFGFKRSAEKCKEKFEEETRNFNSISFNKNRFFSELEEIYHGEKTQSTGKQNEEEEEDPRNVTAGESEEVVKKSIKPKKRKRGERFEKFKGLCIDIMNNMMAQQEEMHNKLLEDMVNRDELKIAREEAWKKQEMERINQEFEIRAHEQAIAGARQATIIEFLKKFTSNSSEKNKSLGISLRYEDLLMVSNSLSSLPSSTDTLPPSKPSSSMALPSQNHNSSNVQKKPSAFTSSSAQKPQRDTNSGTNEREDIGKRWPKDEVLALINMRCNLYSNNNDQDKEGGGGAKGSLWERISQGMLELGYKRSAKRCKEKWENINKYFRKTKDANKKRSVDSRTCPYFHQLSDLYNQGTLVAPVDGPENGSALTKTNTALPETSLGSTDQDVVNGGKNVIQVPGFNFEF